jgi:hypothetical protein
MTGSACLMLAFSQEIINVLPLSSQALWDSTTSGFTKTILEVEVMLETTVLSKLIQIYQMNIFAPLTFEPDYHYKFFLIVPVIQLILLLGY